MGEPSALLHGFTVALSFTHLLLMFSGILLGLVIGVLPGLGAASAMAIVLPLTISLPPASAIILISCVYWGALFAGAITAILGNAPREPWSVATTFDGHPLAQQGLGAQALTAAFISSFVGASFAVVLLTLLAPAFAGLAEGFEAPEFFAVYLAVFCGFVGLGKGSPTKVIASMMLGFALAVVGSDAATGQARMTFGIAPMARGFDFLAVAIGLFGIGGMLWAMDEEPAFRGKRSRMTARIVLESCAEWPRFWATALRGGLLGCVLGIVPGGLTAASLVSYGIAQRLSVKGSKFGSGEMEGVVAPQTAVQAAGASALLPVLALGVPTSTATAVLVGGLLLWGVQPGPLIFIEQKDLVWGLVASAYLGNLAAFMLALTCLPLFAKLLRVPFAVFAPVVVVACAIGAYTVRHEIFDVWLMLGFGVVGYVLKKLDYPLTPLVLALVLGDRVEASFRESMVLSQGSPLVFFSSGLSAALTALALTMLLWPLVATVMRAREAAKAP